MAEFAYEPKPGASPRACRRRPLAAVGSSTKTTPSPRRATLGCPDVVHGEGVGDPGGTDGLRERRGPQVSVGLGQQLYGLAVREQDDRQAKLTERCRAPREAEDAGTC